VLTDGAVRQFSGRKFQSLGAATKETATVAIFNQFMQFNNQYFHSKEEQKGLLVQVR